MTAAPMALLKAAFAADAVTAPAGGRRTFGADGLKVDGKLFAMEVREAVAMKLPRARVDALVAAGEGARLEMQPGRPMKEWILLGDRPDDTLVDLAAEARAFVAGAG